MSSSFIRLEVANIPLTSPQVVWRYDTCKRDSQVPRNGFENY